MKSLPSRGAWIEISPCDLLRSIAKVSLPSRGAWIEIVCDVLIVASEPKSLSSRGAWIEMLTGTTHKTVGVVAPLAGRVD